MIENITETTTTHSSDAQQNTADFNSILQELKSVGQAHQIIPTETIKQEPQLSK